MSTNTSQFQSPFLITTRNFPLDSVKLEPILSKAYTDIATVTNLKTTGIYEKLQVAIADTYFNNGNNPDANVKRQAFRQTYELASIQNGLNTIATNIAITSTTRFVKIYGIAESATLAVPLTPWNMTRTDDAPYLDVNKSTGNIEITTNTGNWTTFSAIVILEYLLN